MGCAAKQFRTQVWVTQGFMQPTSASQSVSLKQAFTCPMQTPAPWVAPAKHSLQVMVTGDYQMYLSCKVFVSFPHACMKRSQGRAIVW